MLKVTVTKGRAVIRVANTTDKNIHLKENKILALVSPFKQDCVFSLNDVQSQSGACNNSDKSAQNKNPQNLTFDFSNSN